MKKSKNFRSATEHKASYIVKFVILYSFVIYNLHIYMKFVKCANYLQWEDNFKRII